VVAYLRLLESLPTALRVQELKRLSEENSPMFEGMYSVEYSGKDGGGISILVVMDGIVFGSDGGVNYDGIYEPDPADPSRVLFDLKLTVPPGVSLATGYPAQPFEYSFKVQVSVPAGGEASGPIVTGVGEPLYCTLRFLRHLPSTLAA
jgi:hypothetical protein